MIVRQRDSRSKKAFLICFTLGIMIPGAYGFIEKLLAFVKSSQSGPIGRIAIIPVLNYLIVTMGFGCLLIWAIAHGMFRDIEEPKYRMLEQEEELDRGEWSDDT